KFQVTAAKYALEDAALKDAFEPGRIGVSSATAYGSLDAITELNRVAELEDPRYINPQRFPNTVINSAAGYVSIWHDLRGPNTTIADGNCGALDALLVARTHLANGRADALLVGGGEVATEPLLAALGRLGLRGDDAPLRVGEGACLFCVEGSESAQARGAKVLAEVMGVGTSFEPPASEAMLVHGSALALEEAIAEALDDAKVDASAINAVVRARCGVAVFDDAESEGLGRAGVAAPALAPKDYLGETFGASGAFAMAAAIESLRRGAKHVLVTTLGYYGKASAAVLAAA
ncbi:MAG: beta-ketoacyl synthase N-terminal-like domain-containing protein, partial [Myxococcota bacterium]